MIQLPVMRECRHWQGMQSLACAAGVEPRSLADSLAGWARKIPCVNVPSLSRLPGGSECSRHVWATEDERRAKFADVYAVDAALDKLTYEEQRALSKDDKAYADFVAQVLRER